MSHHFAADSTRWSLMGRDVRAHGEIDSEGTAGCNCGGLAKLP